jgi:hypothetical protein
VDQVFAIYGASQDAEVAVDELIGAGFDPHAITALFDDNRNSADFAHRKDTRQPRGTDSGGAANVPLSGTWGLLEPGAGPVRGAIEEALAGMGVPDEWAGRMCDGKVLLSVESRNPQNTLTAKVIFAKAAEETGASEADSGTVG